MRRALARRSGLCWIESRLPWAYGRKMRSLSGDLRACAGGKTGGLSGMRRPKDAVGYAHANTQGDPWDLPFASIPENPEEDSPGGATDHFARFFKMFHDIGRQNHPSGFISQ